MGTEGEWRICRMPGYTGFIPGTRHIYGRSIGRIPPLEHLKEKKVESTAVPQETYVPMNVWQVQPPPLKFISGYTGHLPGKGHIFGKTFAQQTEECLANLSKLTQQTQEHKLKEEEVKEIEQNKACRSNQSVAKYDPEDMKEASSKFSGYSLPKCLESPHSKDCCAYEKASIQENSEENRSSKKSVNSRHSTRSTLQAEKGLQGRQSERHGRHKGNDARSDGSRTQNTEKESNCPSKCSQGPFKTQTFSDVSKVQNHPCWSEIPKRATSRTRSRADSLSTHRSDYTITRDALPNHQMCSLNDHCVCGDDVVSGDKFDSCNPCVHEKRGRIHSDLESLGEVASSRDISTEEDDSSEKRYESVHTSQGCKKDYPQANSDHKGCSCYAGQKEELYEDKMKPSDRQASTGQMNCRESTSSAQETRFACPEGTDTKCPVNSKHLRLSTERVQAASDHASVLSLKSQGRSKFEKSTKLKGNNDPNVRLKDTIDKSIIYRTTYDDYNNSARYFRGSLKPPISGYLGYVPRANSTSALGIPFAAHINTNVIT